MKEEKKGVKTEQSRLDIYWSFVSVGTYLNRGFQTPVARPKVNLPVKTQLQTNWAKARSLKWHIEEKQSLGGVGGVSSSNLVIHVTCNHQVFK